MQKKALLILFAYHVVHLVNRDKCLSGIDSLIKHHVLLPPLSLPITRVFPVIVLHIVARSRTSRTVMPTLLWTLLFWLEVTVALDLEVRAFIEMETKSHRKCQNIAVNVSAPLIQEFEDEHVSLFQVSSGQNETFFQSVLSRAHCLNLVMEWVENNTHDILKPFAIAKEVKRKLFVFHAPINLRQGVRRTLNFSMPSLI